MNIIEHLAAQNTHFPLEAGGDKNRAQSRVNIRRTFIRWTETQIQMPDNVATRLLDVYIMDIY